ncbi:MAG TPA: hypothetical protein VIR98_03650 [Candidatus Paceibacterota bacterium]|jgi:hypothetical protein
MPSRILTRIATFALIVSVFAASMPLWQPKEAQAAGGTCLGQIAATIGLGTAASKLLGIPVQNSIVETGTIGTFAQECIIKPLVTQLAKAMLYNITVSTVNWINSGFQGKPGFIQDFRSMLNETADDIIGDFLASEAGFLCSPFSFQVRVALAQTYLPYRQRAACTLTQIVNNVNGFIESDNSGGWDQWLQVTTVPQNNAYGAFVIAQDELSKRIFDAQQIQEKYADWGSGFRDFEVCKEMETQAEANARAGINSSGVVSSPQIGVGSAGAFQAPTGGAALPSFNSSFGSTQTGLLAQAKPRCKVTEKTTPGKFVQERLSATLNVDLQQLAVADNLNAILDALANQVTKQIITGAQGLLGARKSTGGGYGSVDYSAAVANTGSNDPGLQTAIDAGLGTAGEEVETYLNSDEIDAATTTETGEPEEDTNEEAVAEEPFVEWNTTISPQTVTLSSPFQYRIELAPNYTLNSATVRSVLYRNGNPIAFSSAFGYDITVKDGSGTLGTHTPQTGFADINWKGVSASKNAPHVFEFFGYRSINALPGIYRIDTEAKDVDGIPIANTTVEFYVQ